MHRDGRSKIRLAGPECANARGARSTPPLLLKRLHTHAVVVWQRHRMIACDFGEAIMAAYLVQGVGEAGHKLRVHELSCAALELGLLLNLSLIHI